MCVTRLCVPVVHRNVLSFCLKPVQNLVCLAEEFLSRFSCITQANQICVYKNLHQNQSQKQQPLTTVSFQAYFLSTSFALSLCNTCILNPFKGCTALDLTSYFCSNILRFETQTRPKPDKVQHSASN